MARRKRSNSPVNITSKGTTSPAMLRSGVKASPLGSFDPTTGKTYQHPRVTNDPLKGSSVTVTNPKAQGPARAQRTASLGMGGVGQRGRQGTVANARMDDSN